MLWITVCLHVHAIVIPCLHKLSTVSRLNALLQKLDIGMNIHDFGPISGVAWLDLTIVQNHLSHR